MKAPNKSPKTLYWVLIKVTYCFSHVAENTCRGFVASYIKWPERV